MTTERSGSATAEHSNSNGVQEYIERKDPKDEIADLRRELEVQAATGRSDGHADCGTLWCARD